MYVLVAFVMTRPFVNYEHFGSSGYGGDQQLIVWTLAWDNHALLTGTPLFDANVFFPARDALRYNEHLFGVSLFTLPWTAAGAPPLLAHNITWWLAFVLNGLASFVCLRRFVRLPVAAFVGSLAFAYCFYVMLHAHAHLHLIWIWPLPLSLFLVERWFDRPTLMRLLPWVATVIIGLLTSWYVAAMTMAVNVLALVVLVFAPRPSAESNALLSVWRRRALHLLAAGTIGALCVYPFARHYIGLHSTPGEAAAYSATVVSYLAPPDNTVVGRWWRTHQDAQPRPIYGEQTLFAGWSALLLATIGLVTVIRRGVAARVWIFPLLVIVAFLLSLGPLPSVSGSSWLVPFNWLTRLPGADGLRVPARFALVAMLGISGLVAVAVDAIVGRLSARRGALFAASAAVLILAESYVVNFPAGRPEPQLVPPIYRTAQVQSARALVSLPEYQGTERWFLGANYFYYSTVHWRPIVNGFGRTEPARHEETVQSLHAFPAGADRLRDLGVQYVVVHADRFPNQGMEVIAATRASADYRLITSIGSDYLFEVTEIPHR
jgi:hypothetical protein